MEEDIATSSTAQINVKLPDETTTSKTPIGGKLQGFKFWEVVLKKARLTVAPMVEQSELAWRILCRRHKAQLCYTPMIHANLFVNDKTYRKENFATCSEDHPLIAQFCANDPKIFVEAAKIVAPHVEGVDLNLGCPQLIAKKGHYGAFLQDEWDLVFKLVKSVHEEVDVPITCKIRVFEDIQKTVQYAKMLESAGCQLLTVHGRLREQKGPQTGLASWDHIKAVKENVKIPVFANGNIQEFKDIKSCIDYTGVDGIMTAEGNLHNPALFDNKEAVTWEVAEEYLELVKIYPTPLSCIRGHLFKIFHHSLYHNEDLRGVLGKCGSVSAFSDVVQTFKERSLPLHEKYLEKPEDIDLSGLPLPHWICQPYYRHKVEGEENRKEPKVVEENRAERRKRRHLLLSAHKEETGLSKRRLKKLIRFPDTEPLDIRPTNYRSNRTEYIKCSHDGCGNPRGGKCSKEMCKKCCKAHAKSTLTNCEGHRFWYQNIHERNIKTTQTVC